MSEKPLDPIALLLNPPEAPPKVAKRPTRPSSTAVFERIVDGEIVGVVKVADGKLVEYYAGKTR